MGVNLFAKHISDRAKSPDMPLFMRDAHIIAAGKGTPSSVFLVCVPAVCLLLRT